MSPLLSHYQLRAKIETIVQSGDGDADLDAHCVSNGAALAADRTMGGRCDRVEEDASRPVDPPVESAASMKEAAIFVVLHYATVEMLG